MEKPLISILIPAYNASKFITECVSSILQSTYENLEIIIRDDCSTDNTWTVINELAKCDSRINVKRNQINLGYLRTFNKLLEDSTGVFLSFVDADDYIDKNKIKLQFEFLQRNPEIGLVGTQHASISEDKKIISYSQFPECSDEIKKTMKYEMCFCGSSVMVRRRIVKEVGGYREYFIGCVAEDYDWIYRIMELYEVANLNYIGYYYRFHPNSLTRKVYLDFKKRSIHEIVRYLAMERETLGSDFIMRNDKEAEERCIAKLNEAYITDKSKLYREVAVEYAINKDWMNVKKNLQIAMRFSIYKSIKSSIICSLLLVIPYNILSKVKKITGIKHISKKA